MSNGADTELRPRTYRAPMPASWWLGTANYLKFMLRELTCVFVAYFVVITILQIRAVNQGAEAYAEFQAWLASPVMLALSAVALLFVVYHTITWFNVTPRAIVVRVGGKRLSDAAIIAPNYIAWIVISGLVAWLVLGG